MKLQKQLFTIGLMFTMLTNYAQTFEKQFLDGVVYFKIKNNLSISLPEYKGDLSVYAAWPELKEALSHVQMISLKKPFKTKTESVQNIYRIQFSDWSKINEFVRSLNQLNIVDFAEKSQILELFSTPNDAHMDSIWYLTNIQAYQAWDLAVGNSQVKVAIVDDASRITHPDLAANVWHNPLEIADNSIDDDGNGFVDDVNGWDAADSDNDPTPPTDLGFFGEMGFTHGTHCAGLAAGVTNNGVGIASVSHNVSYIPIKTVTDDAFIPLGIETPAEGVDYAIAAGADIISMSFGGEDMSAFGTLQTLIDAAWNAGIICVAAAGNNGDGSGGMFGGTTNAINYPAGLPNVLAVAASDENDAKTSFSQYGTWIDIMSPGKNMYSTLAHSDPYGKQDGTSMACPLTAGALALMKSYHPEATSAQLIQCLLDGADNVDAVNYAFVDSIGAGRLNIYQSLVCLDQTLGVNTNISNTSGFSVYPNPTQGDISIQSSKSFTAINVFDLSGRKVWSNSVNQTFETNVNIQGLRQGLYMIQIDNQTPVKLNIE